MWQTVLTIALRRMIRLGTLEVHFPSGESFQFGNGREPAVTVRVLDRSFARRFMINPELAAGEGYMYRWYTVDDDDLHGFIELGMRNITAGTLVGAEGLFGQALKRVRQLNTTGRARRNAAHHYDQPAGLYDLFLDADRQYSCAYFRTETDTLEAAQLQKKAHVAMKLCLEPGMRVLDLGCGWGGMALTLARDFGVEVVGITLSAEQHRIARDRVAAAGLEGKVDIRLKDYREIHEIFDRIVSVGMFEHVGVPNYRSYFAQIRDLLSPDGIALVHTIGRATPPGRTSPFIAKYVFPGGYIPALSEMTRAIEKEGLWITDLEVWRLHYAMTLRQWHDRFVANIDRAEALRDEKFCRMWRFYLAAAEQTFRHGRQAVFQAQLAKAQDAVPLTRDYMCDTI